MVELYLTYAMADIVGKEKIESDALNVNELLNEVSKRYGREIASRMKTVTIMVNGTNINFLQGRKTLLKSGDKVHLLNPAGGG